MPNVREVTYQLFRDLGLTTMFGNPGSTEEPFLKNFPSDFRYVLALQEASAVAMADGFAQATGRPALVNLHTAAGTGNAMCSILTALKNKTPLIITAGQQTREMILIEPYLTNVDATTVPRPFVKWAYETVRANETPDAIMRAYATALQPPAGPVYLSLPLDDWEKPCDSPAVVRTVSSRVAPDLARVKEFARKLAQARSPVLIYGPDVDRSGGWKEAVALAEALGATVWAAPAPERVPFPENHPLYAGGLPWAIGPLSKKLEGYDVALVVGAQVFRYYPYAPGAYIPKGLQLLHISGDPMETARAPVGDSMLGDPALSMTALLDVLAVQKPKGGQAREKIGHRMAAHPPAAPTAQKSGVLTAAQLFTALNEIRRPHAILVEESPSNDAALHAAWPLTEPGSYFTMASGGLGWDVPAAVGIALGERESGQNRPVVAVIGDGSFQYSVQAIYTAARQQLPVLYVVPDNGEYGVLKAFAQYEQTPGVPGLDLPGIDIVSLAAGYGCDATRVQDIAGFKKAAAGAWTKKKPTVVVVPIAREVPPLL